MYDRLNDYEIIMALISNAVVLGASTHFLRKGFTHKTMEP